MKRLITLQKVSVLCPHLTAIAFSEVPSSYETTQFGSQGISLWVYISSAIDNLHLKLPEVIGTILIYLLHGSVEICPQTND